MHKRFVANIISHILLIVSIVMLAPLAWAFYDDHNSQESAAFGVTIIIGIAFAWFCRQKFKIEKLDYKRVNAKDALAIVGLSWIFLSVLGALPLYLSRVVPTYTDAFFEIASGFTTTGATIFADVESLPRGILFWRSLTHWLGGMGIIVLYLALLPALGQNASQLYKAEAPGITVERAEPRIKETAKLLWTVYFVLTFAEIVLLLFAGMPFFDALCHTFGTMATGGFSTKNASIGAYGSEVQWIIIVFMFLAGTNFLLHYQALRGNLQYYFRAEEFRYYFLVTLLCIGIFANVLNRMPELNTSFRDVVFQVVSLFTTTGYTTTNFNAWPVYLKLILVLLMFHGGCGGSTGGGLKVVRVFLVLKVSLKAVVQAIFPNAVLPIKFDSSALPDKLVVNVMSYFVIFVLLFVSGMIIFSITESCDMVTAMGASIASLSNIGPGLGEVGAIKNYAWVSTQGKWLLVFLMLAGRLELYSILVLFLPSTWKK